MTRKTIAVYGLSGNPSGIHHRKIVESLIPIFDLVIIVPCGPRPEPEKATVSDIAPLHRAEMTDMTFRGLRKVRVDLDDLEKSVFTRTIDLLERYKEEGEVWIVVGADLVQGGGEGKSVIQQEWKDGKRLWETARFVVIPRQGYEIDKSDLPLRHQLFGLVFNGSSTEIRNKAFNHQSLTGFVVPEVESYIERWGLYRGIPKQTAILRLNELKPIVVVDNRNKNAVRMAKKLDRISNFHGTANQVVVIGGDGTMFHAIHKLWRLRLPFLGINAGHRGFLLNDIKSNFSLKLFLEELTLYQSPLLYVETLGADNKKKNGLAFNDAWVQAKLGGTAWIEVKLDGKVRIPKLVADGILVSTPFGSTAYGRAMGAIPVRKTAQNLVLVGSNVFEPLGWSQAHIANDSVVEFRNVDPTLNPRKRPIFGFADGDQFQEVVWMRIRKSNIASVELAFLPGNDPDDKLTLTQFPKW